MDLQFSIALIVYSFASIFGYYVFRVVYNVWFHPLAKYPGPLLAAFSEIWYLKTFLGGDSHTIFRDLHSRHGPVVRVAPNDLSFSTVEATKDIYYHVINGRPKLLKSNGYERPETPSVATVQDPHEHRRQRGSLSHAFSAKAVRSRQHIVLGCVDKFVKLLQQLGTVDGGVNMVMAFNWLTFDTMGLLTFDKNLGALDGNEKARYWTTLLFDGVLWGLMPDFFNRVPILRWVYSFILPDQAKEKRETHQAYTRELVHERLEKGVKQAYTEANGDFFDHMLSKGPVSEDELVSEAMILLAAGSGTVQTGLSGATYYLATNSVAMSKIRQEVRSAFSYSTEINDLTTQNLPYLQATIQETLRMFPPLPSRLPRVSPGTEIDGHFIPKGTIVAANTYNMSHDPGYWTEPDTFNPERWLKESPDPKFAGDDRDAAKPFSTGPRACLGVNLAYLVLRIVIARLVWEFDWELMASSRSWERDMKVLFLWKKPPLSVRFRRRENIPS